MKNRLIQSKGIILSKKKQNEFDDFLTIYSPSLGKINAVSKGSRKITSHFCGHLEPLNICQFAVYKSEYRFTITQAVVEKNFKNIRKNLKTSMLAMLVLEIFQKSTSIEENIEGETLFSLLEKTLDTLSNSQFPLLAIEKFKLELLRNVGALPDITSCSICQKRWKLENTISLTEENHLLCEVCKEAPLLSRKIDFNIIKLMHFLLTENLEKQKLVLSLPEEKKLQSFTNIFLYNYLNKEIFAEKIIDQIAELSNLHYQFSSQPSSSL